MNQLSGKYTHYFKEDKQARICIKMANNKSLDVTGLVCFIKGNLLTLELAGSEAVEEMAAEPGSDGYITFWTGWSICRCSAVLIQKICGRKICLRLTGPVVEKQTREYFRLDVSIPVCYTIPEKQILTAVHEEWAAAQALQNELSAPVLAACTDGFRVVRWNGQCEIAPRPVNLSGGGLRFKTPEYVEPNSLIAIKLFPPLIPPRVIHTVAETLRCSEIVLGWEKGNKYNTAIRFHFISDKDRETIIGFIFNEQRRILNTRTDKRA
jgi:hypothetical protein